MWQLSLRSILIAVLVVACMCAIAFGLAESELLRTVTRATGLLLYVTFVGFAVYDQGHARAFSIGALLPFTYLGWRPLNATIYQTISSYEYPALMSISLLIVITSGVITLLMYHFSRSESDQPVAGRFTSLLQGLLIGLIVGAFVILITGIVATNLEPPAATPFRTHGGVI